MAKITRATQKRFGSTAAPEEIGKFGSLAAGTPEYAASPAEIQEYVNFLGGWFDAILGENSPPIEDMNALFILAFYQIGYILQTGVAEWDADTVYYIGSLVNDGNGTIYSSLTDDNQGNDVSDTAEWKRVGNGMASSAPGAIINSNYTVLPSDNGRILNVDCSAGPLSIQLPPPTPGFVVTVKDITGSASANPISIKRSAAEKIDDVASDDLISVSYSATTYDSDGTDWSRIASFAGGAPVTVNRGLFGGGVNTASSYIALIDYVDLNSGGGGTNFGNLTIARSQPGSCASATRGLWAGGENGSNSNIIDFVEIVTIASATDFGDLTVARYGLAGLSNSTRGVFCGGISPAVATMDYISMASAGNALSFGSLSAANYYLAACASTTRGLIGGSTNVPLDLIEYIEIATLSNAFSFGTLSVGRYGLAGCSGTTRGLWAGGYDNSVSRLTIDYSTFATLGVAANFGDLTTQRYFPGACSSKTIGVFAGGAGGGSLIPSGNVATMDQVTIATLANATSFGSLTTARSNIAGCSGSHGGL